MNQPTLARHLPFQPGLGLCQIIERSGEPTRGASLGAERHVARLARQVHGSAAIGTGPAKEQQIAHGDPPVGRTGLSPRAPEHSMKVPAALSPDHVVVPG
jgi:hypothetical protein